MASMNDVMKAFTWNGKNEQLDAICKSWFKVYKKPAPSFKTASVTREKRTAEQLSKILTKMDADAKKHNINATMITDEPPRFAVGEAIIVRWCDIDLLVDGRRRANAAVKNGQGMDILLVEPLELPLIVSFFTDDGTYHQDALALREDCERLQLDYYIEFKESQGCYGKNCSMKASFILDCLNRFKRPVLWLDADASIKKLPKILHNLTADVGAAVTPSWHKLSHYSGALFFNNTIKAKEFLKTWHEKTGNKVDHEALCHTLRETPAKICDLPLTYCEVQDFTQDGVIQCGLSKNELKTRYLRSHQ